MAYEGEGCSRNQQPFDLLPFLLEMPWGVPKGRPRGDGRSLLLLKLALNLQVSAVLMTSCSILLGSHHGHGFLPEDVEDELIREDVILAPAPSMLKLQIVSKPIDLSAAKVGVPLEVEREFHIKFVLVWTA